MIELKNVTKVLNHMEVLNDISLTLEEGKIYGFVGQNGSGKSMLFRIISGLIIPSTGTVFMNDVDIHKKDKMPVELRALIEKPHFIGNMTGLDNLMMLASIQKRIGKEEVEEVMKSVGLYEVRNKRVAHYSLGMKQKLGVAQVIMEHPSILIFDEPFNGIDAISVVKIKDLILKEKKKDTIILLSSHIDADIKELCDVVYKMEEGRLVSSDTIKIDGRSVEKAEV